ncbi:hypothetical protein [Lentzea sp. NPDC060358]|uniref:hypothetical protein n=1 Tax=Lentzea sp. NPDC060358 TaxID=3347103 RepID=UPI00364C6457
MPGTVFRGVHALLAVVRDLLHRPGWSARSPHGVRGDRPVPLICLVRGDTPNAVLHELENHLDGAAGYRIPYAFVDAGTASDQVAARWEDSARDQPLLPLLDELRHRLMADRFGGRRLSRFRRYRLTDWLTGQRVPPGESRNEREDIRTMLRRWHAWERAAGPDLGLPEAVAGQSALAKIAMALVVAWHRPLRFWLWSNGCGKEPRWLMRQPFTVPGHSTNFTGFAERLTVGRRTEENLEQIKKLLVHSFLQDLRVAYGSGTVRLRRWRRTAYVLVLLENITEDNGGWELLRLINDVRNESTEHDPMLVVATAARQPDWLAASGPPKPVSRAQNELQTWYDDLPARRQALRGDARFLCLELPAGNEPDRQPSDADESAWYAAGTLRSPAIPVPARRSFLAAVLVLVLGAAAVVGGPWLWTRVAEGCLPSPRAAVAAERIAPRPGEREGECVGVSDSRAQVFGRDDTLRKAQLAIFEMNRTADDLHDEKPDRPIVSIVYFSEFTGPENEVGTADSISEELTGLLAQQRRRNVRSDSSPPLLRIVVANGGYEMNQARHVVDEYLTPLVRDDQTVMGVVGMGRTVTQTESAIGALGDLGVPVIATSLTGRGLADRSPVYFQLVAGNEAQAGLVVDYAENPKRITAYSPENFAGDGYLTSLNEHLKSRGVEEFRTWTGKRADTVEPRCGGDKIAFFAGRETDFEGFLGKVLSACKADNRPQIIGDDAVTRFIARRARADNSDYAGVALSYVSLGGLVVSRNRDCYSSDADAQPLCSIMRSLRDPGNGVGTAWREFGDAVVAKSMPWIGERVGIAYDGAGMFLSAVEENKRRPREEPSGRAPNRAAIAQELRELPCPQRADGPKGERCFEGESGKLDFSTNRSGEARPISILAVANLKQTTEPPRCVFVRPADYRC